jgi:hypothetical protein
MRTLRKNQSLLKYSNQAAIVPAFETDENGNIKFWSYIDDDGNEFPLLDTDGNKIPIFADSGTETLYDTPIPFMASIAMSGGEAESVEYGISVEAYEAIIITEKNLVPLTENSLIWFQSEPQYISEETIHTLVNNEEISGMFAKRTSADFFVKKVVPSKNFDKYILGAVNK